MINSIKAEFYKLATTRSTYITSLLGFLLVAIVSFYPLGYKLDSNGLLDPSKLSNDITGSATVSMLFAGVIAIMLVCNEYRHNTIIYSLTNINSRTKFFLSKFIALTIFSALFATVLAATSPAFSLLGIQMAGHELAPQSIAYSEIIWRVFFYGWGLVMYASIIAMIIRNQIGAFVAFFIIPSTVENIATLLIKTKNEYLPFTALTGLLNNSPNFDYTKPALIALSYIISGTLIAYILFVRRDAN